MGQTLSHGVYLPNEGERNCYAGLASNWQILNTAVGNIAEKAPLVHTHGNITNDGKVGTAANKPLITGTGGVVQAGAFGNQANTFCEGNDSRLSDARAPLSHTHTKSDVTDLLNSNFVPSANNTYNLGTSTNKWKTLNSINPGALSLPDYSNAVNIDTTNWSTSGVMITYTPTIAGWLQITVSGGSGSYITILDSGTNPRAGQRITGDGIDRLFLTYPVVANRTYWIYIVSSSIVTARIIPCLGNV